jgi:hypothetical protein
MTLGSADVPSAFHKSLARFGSLSAYGAGGWDVRAPSGTALVLFKLNKVAPFKLKPRHLFKSEVNISGALNQTQFSSMIARTDVGRPADTQ